MTLTLGRCSGLRPGPGYPKIDGDRISIQGTVLGANTDALRGARQQLLGLIGNEDEEIVPCIWASDPTFDGFYRPVSMEVEQLGVVRGRNSRFAATFERIRDYTAPMFEMTVQGSLRVNAHAITAPQPIFVVGFALANLSTLLLNSVLGSATALATTTTSDSAAVTLDRRKLTVAVAGVAVTQYQFSQSPANAYIGSSRIEILYGSTWVPVLGRSIPPTAQGQWRITNGLVRLTLGLTSVANTVFEVWDPVALAWEGVNLLHLDSANTGIGYCQGTTTSRVEILRNGPEAVVVRHSGANHQESFTLNKGARHIVYTRKRSDGATLAITHGIKFAAVTASTAITSGIRSTANDANGNRWLFSTPVVQTTDLVNGSLKLSSAVATPATFMIGAELGGSAATSGNTAAEVVDQFMGAVSWRQRVIAP